MVTCDLDAAEESAGFVIRVQPMKDDRPVGDGLATPGLHGSSEPLTVRAFYKSPAGIRRLRLSVGLDNARGTAGIHEVRFVTILTPEEESHALAIPPPPLTVPGPGARMPAGASCRPV